MKGTPRPTPEQVAELLALLPVFENPDYEPSKVVIKEGQFPYHVQNEHLSTFVETLYRLELIIPYDWGAWQPEAERYVLEPERLQKAPLQDLWKLLTLHVRKDRFCDGHLSLMVSEGHISALLHRLAALYGERT